MELDLAQLLVIPQELVALEGVVLEEIIVIQVVLEQLTKDLQEVHQGLIMVKQHIPVGVEVVQAPSVLVQPTEVPVVMVE